MEAMKIIIIITTNRTIMNKPPLVNPRTVVRAGISNSGKSKSKSGQGKSKSPPGSSVKGISSLTF